MKKPFLIAVLACMMFSSCEKIVGDLDFLQHDLAVQGVINPTLGVPVAHGSISVYDLLQMVQVTAAKVEIGNDGIITITYDTAQKFRVNLDESKGRRYRAGAKSDSVEYVHISRNSIQGSVNIDIFDNIDSSLHGASIEVDNLYVSIGSSVKADANTDALQLMELYHVDVYYDSLYLIAIGKDNSTDTIKLPNVVPIDSLIQGQYIQLFDKTDISHVINKRPKQIIYSVRMNIAFEAEFFATGISESQFVSDSIGVHAVDINADVKVEFPFSSYIKDLSYKTDLQFAPNIDLKELTIDSSMIILDCNNGLPLTLGLSAKLIDSLGNELCELVDPSPAILAGAPVIKDGTGHFVSNGKANSKITIPVTADIFKKLQKTKGIRLDATLNTTSTGNTANKNVAIRSTDMLDINVTAKAKPLYNLNIDLTGNNNNNGNNNGNGQKGGKR